MDAHLGQVVLDAFTGTQLAGKSLPNTDVELVWPAYFALFSVFLFSSHVVFLSKPTQTAWRRLWRSQESTEIEPSGSTEQIRTPHSQDLEGDKLHPDSTGGSHIRFFKFLRLAGCLAMLGLTIATLILNTRRGKSRLQGMMDYNISVAAAIAAMNSSADTEWKQILLCLTYAYASFLSILAVSVKSRWGKIANVHLVTLLPPTWAVFAYRDLWPLATYTLHPADSWDVLLWVKMGMLTFIAVVIPLVIPRQYVPYDPKQPAETPHPEQTVSLLSLISFSHLDPVVFSAYRVPHLPIEKFPLLADYDRARAVRERGFRHLDRFSGAHKEHLFFSLMRIFGRDYITILIVVIAKTLAMYASPVGINKLLSYLEQDRSSAFIRPWFWIAWLFLGPCLRSFVGEWYMFLTCHVSAQAEAMLVQLIFEHALRVRVKGDLSSKSLSNKSRRSSKAGSGRLNNMVTSDISSIKTGRDFLYIVAQAPLVIGLGTFFLYGVLGPSAIVGMVVMLILFPLPGYIAKLTQEVQFKKMKKTDSRVQRIAETMSAIRMVKLFGWEQNIKEKIAGKRDKELEWIRMKRLLFVAMQTVSTLIPLVTLAATFATHTLIMKQQLTASTVFSSMAVFNMLSEQMRETFRRIPLCANAKVSLQRLSEFLNASELLDIFSESSKKDVAQSREISYRPEDADAIGFCNASFVWSDDDSPDNQSSRKFELIVDGKLVFKQGELNLIVGPSGSGKTSLLMALLGEMHFISSGPESWHNLPRRKGVAFASQESWIQNETIRNNILFGAPYDEVRYKKVIHQCALQRDLQLFEAGDQTEVGERGVTLSGGQKARVTLARAVYSSAEILLLDDVLAALDVHTSRWIVIKCFQGDLVQGRTVLLVTHNVDLVKPYAAYVVSLEDGRVVHHGPNSEARSENRETQAETMESSELENEADEGDSEPGRGIEDAQKSDGKLVAAEEIALGHVGWKSVKLYLQNVGGVLFWLCFLSSMILVRVLEVFRNWYLGYWATQYELHKPSDVNVLRHFTILCATLVVGLLMNFFGFMIYIQGGMRASRLIHNRLLSAILSTTLRWLDTTPTGRILSRFTQDIKAVDGSVADRLGRVIELTLQLVIYFAAIVYMSPVMSVPSLVVGTMGGLCGHVYIKAQLSVKREMSNAKSPVLSHVGAAMGGLVSIRAFGAEEAFKTESLARIDKYTRTARIYLDLNRWISFRMYLLGTIFSTVLTAYLVYAEDHGPGTASDTGFLLNLAVGFSSMILIWVRASNDFEVSGNSLERIKGYIDIEQESKPSSGGIPPAYWPSSGNLHVEKLSARYSPDGVKVLHDLSFSIRSGERIGVVGRTGSGKSSLTLSLLRAIFTEGDIIFDGLSTRDVNLDVLRQKITIIPQVPDLLGGTLRYNLDPFDDQDDATLNAALRSAGLYSLQTEDEEGRITLDTQISSGGSNLSVGQRQIIALARAIVRRSKLLILDEATSAIDYATDSVIQNSLRNELGKDITCITVAHRLQTIMDADRIMVLDAGRLVEFDTPQNLLQKEGSLLRALVDESGDRDALYSMASAEDQTLQSIE